MKLNLYDNVDQYLQFLTFFEFNNINFQIYYHSLKRYNIRFEKIVNLEIVHKMYFYYKINYFCYVINNIIDIYNYYNIFIRVNDFIFHVLYRYKRDHLFNL